MQDLNTLSFAITGEATSAKKAINDLTRSLGKLDKKFTVISNSGERFITSLSKISNAITKTDGVTEGLKTSNNTLANSCTKLSVSNKKLSDAITKTKNKTAKAIVVNKKANVVSKTSSSRNKAYTSSLGKLLRRMGQITVIMYTLRKAYTFLNGGVRSAIAYVENLNLFMVALSKNTSRATSFIKEMSTSLYLDEAKLTRVQGLFYQISESLGLSSENAFALSTNFTKLAYDLASFYNISVDEAVTKLQAGLVGETEPLRRLGIILTENNLTETARNMGITKSIRNMTEQEKIQLRYVTALQQTQNAQGDLARTMKQPENLIRIFQEQLSRLTRQIGNSFIPSLEKIAPELIGITMALTKMATAIAITNGYKTPKVRNDLGGYSKVVADTSKDIAKSTGSTVKNLATALKYTKAINSSSTGIDELNVMNNSSANSIDSFFDVSSATKATNKLNWALGGYNNAMSETDGTFDAIVEKWTIRLDKLSTSFNNIFDSSKVAFTELIDSLFGGNVDTFSSTTTALKLINTIITGILTGITNVVDKFKLLWNNILKPMLQSISPKWLDAITSQSMVDVIAKATELFILWKTLKIASGVVASLGSLLQLSKITPSAKMITMLGALSVLQVGFKVSEAIVDGDWKTFTSEILSALVAGLLVGGLTGSVKGGLIALNIGLLLDFNLVKLGSKLADKFNLELDFGLTFDDSAMGKAIADLTPLSEVWTIISENFISAFTTLKEALTYLGNSGKNTAKDIITAPTKFSQWSNGLLAKGIKAVLGGTFANGGIPQKGSLFIAGEAGAELVGDLGNGGTSVVNKKQMGELGIPQFADGVNVPKWTRQERLLSSAINIKDEPKWTTQEQENSIPLHTKITTKIDDFFDALPNLITKTIKDMKFTENKETKKTFKIMKYNIIHAFDVVKTFGIAMWEGISDSKIIQSLMGNFALLVPLLNGFKKGLKIAGQVTLSFFSAFKANANGEQEIMKSAPEGGGSTGQQQDVMSTLVSGMLGDSTLGIIFNLMQNISSGMIEKFLDSLPQFIQAGMDMLVGLVDGVVKALPVILGKIPAIITSLINMITNPDAINAIINGAIMIVVELVKALPNIIISLVNAIPTIIMTLIHAFTDNIGLFLKLGVFIGLSILDGIGNILFGGINEILKKINKLIPGTWLDIPLIPKMNTASIVGFADGGYPTTGQAFIAREAGVELVGNVGGKAGVVNNDQIVESVSKGVYEAVVEAMAQTQNKETIINLDGKRVSERLDISKRTTGLSFGTGGY